MSVRIHVGSAQLSVAAGGNDPETAFFPHFHDGDVEGTPTKVKDEDFQFFACFFQTVGKTRRGGLVDDSQNFETGDFTSVLGRGALVIVEISRTGNDHLFDGIAEISFGVLLDLLQNERRDLLRCIIPAEDFEFEIRTHFAFGRHNRAFCIDRRLSSRRFADEPLAVFSESDIGGKRFTRRHTGAFRRRDNDRLATFHYSCCGIGGS